MIKPVPTSSHQFREHLVRTSSDQFPYYIGGNWFGNYSVLTGGNGESELECEANKANCLG